MNREYICLAASLLLFLALPLNCAQSSYADTQEKLENVVTEIDPVQEPEIQTPEEQPPVQQQGYNDSLDNMQEELEELKKDLKELKKRRRAKGTQ